jgi:hypothetical protein
MSNYSNYEDSLYDNLFNTSKQIFSTGISNYLFSPFLLTIKTAPMFNQIICSKAGLLCLVKNIPEVALPE